jgi:hypothetical protein
MPEEQRATSYPFRMPPELKSYIQQQAKQNDRTLHGELVNRLRRTIKQDREQGAQA